MFISSVKLQHFMSLKINVCMAFKSKSVLKVNCIQSRAHPEYRIIKHLQNVGQRDLSEFVHLRPIRTNDEIIQKIKKHCRIAISFKVIQLTELNNNHISGSVALNLLLNVVSKNRISCFFHFPILNVQYVKSKTNN